MNKKGIVFTILSALIYGFTPVLCALTYEMGNDPITLTFFRSFYVVPVLGIWMISKKISFKLSRYDLISIVLVGLFGAVLTTVLLYSSYSFVGVGTATTLHFLYPIFVTLICKFVYSDVITKKQVVSLFLALLGIMFFMDFNNLSNIQGIIMALVSGITFAIYLVLIEKRKLSLMNGYKFSFYLAVVVTITFISVNGFKPVLYFNQPLQSYGLMFIVSMLASFIAIVFLKEGIRLIGSNYASIFSLLEPISSVVFGIILLNEQLSMMKGIGCIIIVLAINNLANKKKNARTR